MSFVVCVVFLLCEKKSCAGQIAVSAGLCVRSCASCASCGMSICLSKKGGVFHWPSGLLWWALV